VKIPGLKKAKGPNPLSVKKGQEDPACVFDPEETEAPGRCF
jgi:hypothetical protein